MLIKLELEVHSVERIYLRQRCLVYGLKFVNAKIFLYIKFILLFCILFVRMANVITSLIYL